MSVMVGMTGSFGRAVAFGRSLSGLRRGRYQGVLLSIRNRGGSVEHYHHFLLGFLVPLVNAWPGLGHRRPDVPRTSDGQVLVRSCAVMDPLLREMPLAGLRIIDKRAHASLSHRGFPENLLARGLRRVEVEGYDLPDAYDREVFRGVRERLFHLLAAEIEAAATGIADLFPGTGPRVVLIDRLPPGDYYRSPRSEIPGSGAERRSIPNMQAVCDAARAVSDNVALVTLEGKGLAYQMALFATVDVVIAQHGAALANLIWSRPDLRLIEIVPEPLRRDPAFRQHFSALCHCLGLGYRAVPQDTVHSAVDAGLVGAVLHEVLRAG